MEKVNLITRAESISELNQYFKVGQLNDHILNIITAEKKILDFHSHEDSDEILLVIGTMMLEFVDTHFELNTGVFLVAPKKVHHMPICTTLVKCLLIEKVGTFTKANTGSSYSE